MDGVRENAGRILFMGGFFMRGVFVCWFLFYFFLGFLLLERGKEEKEYVGAFFLLCEG